ncbi:tetratricopeptide repeat protein [Clostridium sp.]|uniref:tetratricopeptide repeat protein n=1 Tax=Clostridium sp. TaxID=1506 RepID=UPI003216E26D
MKLNKFLLCSVAFVIVTSTVIMGGCKSKDKEIVLSKNVAKDIQVEENEIEKYIKEGNKFLEEKNYTEARKSYEAAIAKGKNDKQIYMDIKDKYIEKGRYDDAYHIIKLAIENKVDTENMEKELTSIRDKMEIVELSYEIYEDKDSFVLPEEVDITVDNNKVKDYVLWEKENHTISNKPGQYSYNGVTKEYGRNVHVTLNVKANIKEDIKENAKEDIYDSKFGIVKDIYTDNGTVYISFDEAEFYFGWEEAVAEAVKDNKAMQKEDGTYTLPDPYYIRYHIGEIKVYEVSKDASFNLLSYDVDPSNNHTSELQSVDYSTFKKKIDNWKGGYVSNLQFNVDMKNGIVTKMSKQYTP